jgi:hypothetical protein
VDASLAARVPRLELCLALIAASLGLIIAVNGRHLELIPFTWEPALVGGVIGALTGTILRHRSLRLRDGLAERREKIVLFFVWAAGGSLIGLLVCLIVPMTVTSYLPPAPHDGVFLGAVVAAAVSPACYWLMRKSQECVRARRGSIVAGADRRSIWSATAVVLALASLTAIPPWTTHRLMRLSPSIAGAIAGVATLIALAAFLADARALREVRAFAAARRGLESFGEDEELQPAKDLGIGDEVLGRVDSGGTYRHGGARVPLVRGSTALAELVLDEARLASQKGLLVSAGALAAHAVALAVVGPARFF